MVTICDVGLPELCQNLREPKSEVGDGWQNHTLHYIVPYIA